MLKLLKFLGVQHAQSNTQGVNEGPHFTKEETAFLLKRVRKNCADHRCISRAQTWCRMASRLDSLSFPSTTDEEKKWSTDEGPKKVVNALRCAYFGPGADEHPLYYVVLLYTTYHVLHRT